jgi:hypothetical protein
MGKGAFRRAGGWAGEKNGFFSIRLDGFEDLAATQAARTDSNAFRLPIDECPDWLKVGLEDPLGLVIGVTDVMAGLAAFATEIACKCHGDTPLPKLFQSRYHCESPKRITGLFDLTSNFMG